MEDPIKCPKCGSTQITADKKGFSAGKAIAGAALTGGVGLAAGAIGRNKIIITCLACGHSFKPGQKKTTARRQSSGQVTSVGIIAGVVVMVLIIAIILLIF